MWGVDNGDYELPLIESNNDIAQSTRQHRYGNMDLSNSNGSIIQYGQREDSREEE